VTETILITGATGVLGRAIVKAAVEAGLDVRQGVRNPAKAAPGVEAVRLDYADPATVAPALAGISGLLLIAPPLDPTAPAQLRPLIDAAKSAGIRHIVFNSALGANASEDAPLRTVEHLVIDSGIPYTILRPSFFMENFSEGFLAGGINAHGAIFLAAGDGKTGFISVADIAAVAVAAFQKRLTGQEFDLTGPEALDHREVARIISAASGRAVTYHSITEAQMIAGARALGIPEPAIGYMAKLYAAVRAGYTAVLTPAVEEVLGRKPVRFEEFAHTSADAFKQA
jgi:uncharacterized protein YbjT (DUF2867 family)